MYVVVPFQGGARALLATNFYSDFYEHSINDEKTNKLLHALTSLPHCVVFDT